MGVRADKEHLTSPFANHEQANYKNLTTPEALAGGSAGTKIGSWSADTGVSDFYSDQPSESVTYDVPGSVSKK